MQSGTLVTGDGEKMQTPVSNLRKPHTFSVDAPPFDPSSFGAKVQVNSSGAHDELAPNNATQWGFQQSYMVGYANDVGLYTPANPFGPSASLNSVKREGDKEGLSVHAKPWSPCPEKTVGPAPEVNFVDITPVTWVKVDLLGKEVMGPAPLISKEASNNLFIHSFVVVPRKNIGVELELFNYLCSRCPLRTLFGKLSSRKADVILRNIAPDVPPLCIAHLVEQITNTKVAALYVNVAEGTQYALWLEKPNMSSQVVNTISGTLWMSPMYHGFAVFPKNDEAKKFLGEYLAVLKASCEDDKCPFPFCFIEAKEH